MEFEKQLRLSMVGTDKLEKERRSWTEQKKVEANKSEQEFRSKSNVKNKQEFNLQVQKINELSQRIDRLENMVQEIISSQKASQSKRAMGANSERPRENRSDGQDQNDSLSSLINIRVRELEKNYETVNEVQAGIIIQIGELVEKHNLMLEKWEKKESEEIQQNQNPIIKTLYIDKFYLDKYEQHNNIGQIGIHALSGALNIGATYGKDVIPSRITEEVQEEIEKIKSDMEGMEKPPTGTDETDKPEEDESSSDSTPIPDEGEEDFTEIWIED
ncbi:hypothetical protein [Neobacillus sp. SuZ13]|uniref:hypothetical protein n=1 Tax=Neobacillus sp. SuZ13 TaxID=3047875 RepID=UPI0024BF96AD|nr:hypothetical protein [Neobacillus sp. SuZ13]WHY66730.1 hypothetical protein QNH17_27535 [Neobacillus sp. SuZ13]